MSSLLKRSLRSKFALLCDATWLAFLGYPLVRLGNAFNLILEIDECRSHCRLRMACSRPGTLPQRQLLAYEAVPDNSTSRAELSTLS